MNENEVITNVTVHVRKSSKASPCRIYVSFVTQHRVPWTREIVPRASSKISRVNPDISCFLAVGTPLSFDGLRLRLTAGCWRVLSPHRLPEWLICICKVSQTREGSEERR